jgi:hypothetical protein
MSTNEPRLKATYYYCMGATGPPYNYSYYLDTELYGTACETACETGTIKEPF